MSRSYRHSLIGPVASDKGIKWYKRVWNSKERRRWKDAVKKGLYDLAEFARPWNEWDSPRDGKVFYGPEWYNSKKRLSK
jgi:hypothetical protein